MNAKPSKTSAPSMPIDLDQLLPPAAAVTTPSVEEPTVETPEVVPTVQDPQFEQDEAKRQANFDAALAQMATLGEQAALGNAALTNAGIAATKLVYDKHVNDAHVEAMYMAFAQSFNAKAKGGERMDSADKSAVSRLRTFFKPEVVAFVYGSGANHNWHDTVADIREGISADNRKGSLYNALVLFNREVVKAEKAAVTTITEEFVTKLLTKDEVKDKTDLERLKALVKAFEATEKKTGLTGLAKIKADLDAYIATLGPTQTSAKS